jgi:hypothetical protein
MLFNADNGATSSAKELTHMYSLDRISHFVMFHTPQVAGGHQPEVTGGTEQQFATWMM